MVRPDHLDADRGLDGPPIAPAAGDLLEPLPPRDGLLDARRLDRRDPLPRDVFGTQAPAHQDVRYEARLDRRVPSVEVHRGIRLEEPLRPRRFDAIGIRLPGLDLGEDEVARAVEAPLKRFDARPAQRF